MNKIGFACKWVDADQKVVDRSNCKTITRAWAERQTDEEIYMKLASVASHNIDSIQHMCDNVHKLPIQLQMFRISSEILPLYTIRRYAEMYRQMLFIVERFREVGNYIRALGVTVSFHPGQFCCLASERPEVVKNSIAEIEYHADMARMMGFGRSFQDGCKINVHVSGVLSTTGFRQQFYKLSDVARNLLTVENDEYSCGLDKILELEKDLPIVMDIHHHWISTGQYINCEDDRVRRVISSWRNRTPSMHYAVSREDLLIDHPIDVKPNLEQLLSKGFKKGKLRAHSDYYWNTAVNEWASTFTPHFNIMCESKMKNLASIKFYEEIKC
jgi:UV DNA damage repair endonuclease